MHSDSSSDCVQQLPYPILSYLTIMLEEKIILESIIIKNKSYHVYMGWVVEDGVQMLCRIRIGNPQLNAHFMNARTYVRVAQMSVLSIL